MKAKVAIALTVRTARPKREAEVLFIPPEPRDIGGSLRKVREDLGLHQVELGNVMGLSKSTISRIEANAIEPGCVAIWRLESFLQQAGLGVQLKWLQHRKSKPQRG